MLPLMMLTLEIVLSLFINYLISTAGETWTKSFGPKYTEILAFWQKKKKKKKGLPFWESFDAILRDISVT